MTKVHETMALCLIADWGVLLLLYGLYIGLMS